MVSTNLPIQLTNFIGRERDLAEVDQILSTSRLITLTGMGGGGKTRLAIEVANRASERFKDGVWFVGLASLREPNLVPQFVLETLGLRLVANQSLLDALKSFLQSKQYLLILDNCEHLREACAELAQQLLSYAPELQILATSREPLAVMGETIYPVSGLDRPGLDGKALPSGPNRPNLNEFMEYDAVHLFVERARALSPHFTLTSENANTVAEVCQHLDGLPLALELASARINVLTVQEIAARLDDRFSFLTSRQRTGLEPRHHTLRATIDWSYDLLKANEQMLLRRMAVFTAGCTLDMLEIFYAGELSPEESILDLITSLINKSFIVAETTGRTQVRYRLLESIGKYLLEKLDQAGETIFWHNRHLDLFVARVEEVAPKLTEAYQQLWLNWLEGEHDNLRASLSWSLECGRIEAGLRIVLALVPFWEIRGFMQECKTWHQRLLAQMKDDLVPLDIQVKALIHAAYMAMAEGDVQANTYGREAVRAAEASGNKALISFALNFLGASAQAAGDHQAAFTVVERAIPIYRESGPPYDLRMALYLSGENAVQLGKYEIARERLNESLSLCQRDGDFYHIANIYNALGDLARLEQNYIGAASAYESGAALLRELDSLDNLALILGNLGFTYLYLGRIEQAQTCFNEGMALHLARQNEHGQTECLIGFGATAVKCGQTPNGVRLLAAAAFLSGLPYASHWKANQMEFARYNDLARTRLAEADYLAGQAVGQSITLEQAVAYAQSLMLSPEMISGSKGKSHGLTDREREVAALIAQGKANGEIAAELVLSKRTVEKHIANILSKLSLTSRTQIVRWVLENGLSHHSL